MKISRRDLFGLSALGLGGGYSFFVEPSWHKLTKYQINSPKWPEGTKPLHIAFASDFHVGCPSVGFEELSYLVDKINALKADVIFLGGDFLISGVVLGHYKEPQPIADVLKNLSAPLGVYSVLGNHDWIKDGHGMWKALEMAGIHVLENSALKVHQYGHSFWVAGMADDSTRSPDYQKTLKAVTDKDPVFMLAHDPASFMDIGPKPVLTLCGHTHGGQVVIPYVSPIIIPGRAPLRYAYGHVAEEGRDLIVSSGIGTSVLPVRFGRRPEILSIKIG